MDRILIKEIGYHVTFWVIYFLFWSAQELIYFRDYIGLLKLNLLCSLPYILAVYANLWLLAPRFLYKKRYLPYIVLLVFTVGLFTWLAGWNHFLYFEYIVQNSETGLFFISAEGNIILSTEILVLVGFSTAIRLLRERYREEQYIRRIEKRQLESELKQLKEQLNPHFLFNSLNSIYMMLSRDTSKGKEMLLRFSDILSHQLYEANKEFVSLELALKNLLDYINIESIRHGKKAVIQVDVPQYRGKLSIAPLLMLPLVENAFKHSPSHGLYHIKIKVKIINEKGINLIVSNSFSENIMKNKSGIGLNNLERRLTLLYKNKHSLDIEQVEDRYKVHLNVILV